MDLNRPALNRASSRLRAGGGNLSSYAYAVNAIGQRQTVTTGGTAMAAPATTRWGYDGLGQLVAEDFGNNQAANPRDRGYAYDLIGNRKNSIQGVTDPLAAGNLAYHANPLNQYDSIGAFQPVHDDDGNLTTGRLHSAALGNVGGTPYTGTLHWNGEKRLAKVEDGSTVKATYQYDFMGRRVRKQVGNTVTWYVYDGYNELGRFTQTGTGAPTIQRTFTWGLDISNTPQGAGGVGGLLAVKVYGTTSATYFPTYDANGNISEYLASNGSVAAHFEYDGFGNTVVNTDTNGLFDYRFSTKPLEDVTGLYYYLYRDYDPVAGRWVSRDLIAEEGGVNLYGFLGNDRVNQWDLLGNFPIRPFMIYKCDCSVEVACDDMGFLPEGCCEGRETGKGTGRSTFENVAKSYAQANAQADAADKCANSAPFLGCGARFDKEAVCSCRISFGINPFPLTPYDPFEDPSIFPPNNPGHPLNPNDDPDARPLPNLPPPPPPMPPNPPEDII